MSSDSLTKIVVFFSSAAFLLSCGLQPGDAIFGNSDQSAIIFVKQPITGRELNVQASNVEEFIPGTDIYSLSPVQPSGNLTPLTRSYHNGEGAAMDPEVSPDGEKILFAMKKSRSDRWRIYEMDKDGTDLVQLTSPPQGDDFDPAYLPNGDIVFASTRTQIVDEYERRSSPQLHVGKRTQGHSGDIPNENVRQISFNQSHDANPMVHSSGKIYFSRWEHLGNINKFSLFTINPDGTGLFLLYGSHVPSGDGSRVMLEPRELGDRGLMVSVMTRTSPNEGGAIAVLDLATIEGEPRFVTNDEVLWNNNDEEPTQALFKTPYPIMDGKYERIITAMSPIAVNGDMDSPPVDYGIYIMDKNGEDLSLVYNDPDYNELDPMPLKASHLPPAQTIAMDENVANGLMTGATTGMFFNSNAYLRSGNDGQMTVDKNAVMVDGIAGEARFYRVLEAIPLPRDYDMRGGALGNTNLEKERVIGYVPIRSDGSASMEVPANKALHLQSVDYRGMLLVSQRTWVQVMPGEKRMCTGCHGPHDTDPIIFNFAVNNDVVTDSTDPANLITYIANFLNPPNPATFSPSGTGYVPVRADTLDFYRSDASKNTVQKIFNNRCNSCHGAGVAAASGGGFALEHTGMFTEEDGDMEVSNLYEFLTSGNQYNNDRDYVSSSGARNSPLIWVLFDEQLNSGSGDYAGSSHDHTAMWAKTDGRVDPFLVENADLLTLIEWIDAGRQYSNTIGYTY